MAATNPITLVYDALWTLLEARTAITTAVPASNRIKLTGTRRDPHKGQVKVADLPEITIASKSIRAHQHRTSNSTSFLKEFIVKVKTPDKWLAQDTTESTGLFDLEFAIVRAMTNWVTTMTALTWNSKSFVTDCRVLEGQEEISDDNRSYSSWQVVWRGEVEFWFETSDLTAT